MRKLFLGKTLPRYNLEVLSGNSAKHLQFGVVDSDPYAAHVAALQAISNAGGYYTAQDYTASLSQAGKFVDAFGGVLTYESPNVMASPTRVVDAQSGLAYVSSDGADDTAIGSAVETVAACTCLIRSPQATWSNYGGPLDVFTNGGPRAASFNSGGTNLDGGGGKPRGARRNGVALNAPYDLAPTTAWQTVTLYLANPEAARVLSMASVYGQYNTRLHLAALRTWPTDPSDSVVQQTEAEMARYFAPLLNPQAQLATDLSGKVDGLLVPTASTYSNTAGTAGVLTDSLGGSRAVWTAPNAMASPTLTQSGSQWQYLSADGADDTLVADRQLQVGWYCAVFRSPPGQTTWSNYGSVLDTTNWGDGFQRVGDFTAGDTTYEQNGLPMGVRRNGSSLASPYNLAPTTSWMVVTVRAKTVQNFLLQLFGLNNSFPTKLHLAALAYRTTDPDADTQTDIENKLGAIRDALNAAGS